MIIKFLSREGRGAESCGNDLKAFWYGDHEQNENITLLKSSQ